MKMDCKDIQERIPDYLSGKLEEAVWSRVDDHLAECKNCSQFIKEYQLIDTSLKNTLSRIQITETISVGLKDKIYAKIQMKKKLSIRYLVYKSAAAVLLIGIGITLMVTVKSQKDNIIPAQPTVIVDNSFDSLDIPKDTESKILFFSKLIGSDKFTLSFNKSKDEFLFITDNVPANLNGKTNHWDEKLQKILNKCFPKTQLLVCKVEKGKCNEFSIIE
jgi:hypothetical protein